MKILIIIVCTEAAVVLAKLLKPRGHHVFCVPDFDSASMAVNDNSRHYKNGESGPFGLIAIYSSDPRSRMNEASFRMSVEEMGQSQDIILTGSELRFVHEFLTNEPAILKFSKQF